MWGEWPRGHTDQPPRKVLRELRPHSAGTALPCAEGRAPIREPCVPWGPRAVPEPWSFIPPHSTPPSRYCGLWAPVGIAPHLPILQM